jgi:prophage maintenance system killer protein
MNKQKIEIYKTDNGQHHVDVRFEEETLWLSQSQMAQLFDKDVRTVNEHIKNIFSDKELEANEATIRNFRIVQKEGNRQVNRNIEHYNLDMVISVGYRVNSKKGTQFRIWATQKLRDYLVKGYSFDSKRFQKNAKELNAALELIKKTAQSPELNAEAGRGLVEIVSRYTQTFLWLQAYDEGLLNEPQGQEGGKLPSEQQAEAGLAELKQNLMAKDEATELFANPRGDGLGSILGNLQQTVFGEPAYPSIESKAAHLLYFMVKNHPFSDGNKRSGAFLFVDFLHRNNRLFNTNGETVINDTGLAALPLLVAESDPKQKETMIRLIMNMLSQEHNS